MSVDTPNAGLRDRFRHYLQEDHFLAGEDHLLPMTLALYRRLGTGGPVPRSVLADDLGLSSDAVNELISELPQSTIDTDANGSIVAFGGLSQSSANHVFVVDGNQLHTWCVFDALFLPQILSKPAVCETTCPTTQQRIVIELSPSGITSSHPAFPVMSIVAPSRDACCDNLRGAFCDHVNFFADETAYQEWAADKTDVTSVSLNEAHKLAHLRNQFRYGDNLHSA